MQDIIYEAQGLILNKYADELQQLVEQLTKEREEHKLRVEEARTLMAFAINLKMARYQCVQMVRRACKIDVDLAFKLHRECAAKFADAILAIDPISY
jgi:hypothetical protein